MRTDDGFGSASRLAEEAVTAPVVDVPSTIPSRSRFLLTLEEIRAAIASGDADWVADETPIFRAGIIAGDPASLMFGLSVEDETGRFRAAGTNMFEQMILPEPPPAADWRAAGRVTDAKDQGRCGACVAFATCATLESSIWIGTGTPVSLSEGHLFHCNGGSCSTGWGLTHGLDASTKGVGAERDLPWSTDGVCRRIDSVVRVVNYQAHQSDADRKRAVSAGPVLAGMKVFEDFLAYHSGVYRHAIGNPVGNHAVCVVGYDDGDGAWLVKNSWGRQFGDEGFFRIAYGEAGLDSDHPFYSVETTS